MLYLSLGSNMGDKLDFIQQAVNKIHYNNVFSNIKSSSIYKTEPISHIQQDFFLNIVLELKTKLSAEECLNILQSVENRIKKR